MTNTLLAQAGRTGVLVSFRPTPMNTAVFKFTQGSAWAFATLVVAAFINSTQAEERPTIARESTPAFSKEVPKPGLETTPAPLVPDVQPQAKRRVAPVYPYEMLVAGRSGWAEADFLVDHSGRAQFTNPHGSDREFALAMTAMVEASDFSPARKGKRPIMAPSIERHSFNGEASLDAEARRVLTEIRGGGEKILAMSELSERPIPITQSTPIYPRGQKCDKQTGQAEIEFIISREGRVLFPRIISSSHEDFGWAAATAIAQWRFQPPVKNGANVDVRIKLPVIFDARQLAESD